MYFEQLNELDDPTDSSTAHEHEPEQMLIFEGDPYMEFPEEKWVAAPVKKGVYICEYIEWYR